MRAKADFKVYNEAEDATHTLMEKYAVHSFPTVIYADGGGKELTRTNGFGTAEAFEEQISSLMK
jgi:thioredoxin-related protein